MLRQLKKCFSAICMELFFYVICYLLSVVYYLSFSFIFILMLIFIYALVVSYLFLCLPFSLCDYVLAYVACVGNFRSLHV